MSDRAKHGSEMFKMVAQQVTVVFADAEITAVKCQEDGYVYAALPDLCLALGLDTQNQYGRIEEHVVLVKGLVSFNLVSGIRVVTTRCLRANLIPLWLALVPVKRLKPERQELIYLYQERVADVLDRLFGPDPEQSSGLATAQEPAYAEGLAIARLGTRKRYGRLKKRIRWMHE